MSLNSLSLHLDIKNLFLVPKWLYSRLKNNKNMIILKKKLAYLTNKPI